MQGPSINLTRIKGNTETNYFMMITKKPIKKFLYKIKVTGIYTSDRFLDMGLISETRKNACSNLINSFGSSGNFSYCGYSYSGVTGTSLSSSSSSGFEVGTEVFIDYNGKKLMIYTKDKKANLSKDLPTGNYYLFFVVYHKDTSCMITKLK